MGVTAGNSFAGFRISEHSQYRFLEIIPGAMVWLIFGLAIVVSFLQPVWAIVFIIVFDLSWLIRAVYNLVYLLVAYRRYRRTIQVDWRAKLMAIKGWERLVQVVVLPIANEPYEVVRGAFEGLAHSDYPLDRLVVAFACEDRNRVHTAAVAAQVEQTYGNRFGKLLVSFHPSDLPGELAGKGANIAWAGRRVKEWIDQQGVPYDDVLVTTLDVDSVVHRQYFAYLSWVFLNHPRRTRTSYQPLAFYHNNIWQSSPLTRIVANSTTFWLMAETVRPDRLFTFSSHSMPFRALVDVDFWQNDIVTEDSRIFLQCFVEYDGDYSVTPLYLPISMDTVSARSFWPTVVNQYKQQRRWAYGVENFPFMAWNFRVNAKIAMRQKVKYIWNQLEGVVSWATAPILIFILGWLPLRIAEFRGSDLVIVQLAPDILKWLMISAMVGMVAASWLATVILPPLPPGHRKWRLAMMIGQWFFLPLTLIFFGSIPAADAQTRLMLGRYLGFWVTEKTRRSAAV